ncbi:MAG: DUF1638 domain-containing protein [Methanothrix sp.]|nr:DUF1638 domain-containing protein [Methanothrix sp.]
MYAILACGVFEREIESLRGGLGFPFEAHYLDAGLHVDFDELGDELRSGLDLCSGYDGTVVVYGQCHPRISEILEPYCASLLDCQNCVDALITRETVEAKASEGLYFYLSPGWLDAWQDVFERLGWDQTEARLQMGSFRGAIYMDTMKDAATRHEELLGFFDFTNLPFEVMPVDLDHFRSLIIDAKERLEG